MFHSDRAGKGQETDQRPPATVEHMFAVNLCSYLPGCGTFIRTFFVTPTSGGQAPARFASQRSQQVLPELFVRAIFVGPLATQIDSKFYQICPSLGCQSKRRGCLPVRCKPLRPLGRVVGAALGLFLGAICMELDLSKRWLSPKTIVFSPLQEKQGPSNLGSARMLGLSPPLGGDGPKGMRADPGFEGPCFTRSGGKTSAITRPHLFN
jgi:hypothetical protein